MKIAFKIFIFLVLALAAICSPDLFVVPSYADVLFMRDGNKVYGRLRKTTDSHIFFDQRIAANQYRERTIRNEEVITTVVTIVDSRLEELDPLDPHRYRDLAEELAMQQADPEARDLALRLYLLAARLGDEELRRSSFLGMFAIARSVEEEKRLRALACQSTSGGSGNWLHGLDPEPDQAADDSRDSQILTAIRLLRGQQPASGMRQLEDPATLSRLADFSEICTWPEIKRWSSPEGLGYSELSKLLQLEIALSGRRTSADFERSDSWPTLLKQRPDPIHLVDFANVTEFDVANTIYRNGQWTRPPQDR